MLKDYENHTQPLSEKKKIAFSDGLDITVIILVVGLFVAIILAFLAEFMFDLKINWKEVGIDTGIVAACTVAIYLLLRSFAQRRGRKTERYGKAAERLQDMNREIIEHNLTDKVRDYCREWERKQLDSDRSAILNSAGITIEEYKEKYGSDTYGVVAYILNIVRIYSIPFCFIGVAISAIYQYVLGIRKLDTRDKGFAIMISIITIFIIAQVLPLIFAIVVKGWRG